MEMDDEGGAPDAGGAHGEEPAVLFRAHGGLHDATCSPVTG